MSQNCFPTAYHRVATPRFPNVHYRCRSTVICRSQQLFFSHSKQTLFANLHPLTISLEQVEKVNFALSMIRLQRHQTMFICLFVRFDHRETCTFFTPHNRLTEQNVFGEFIYCAHANLIVKSLQLISIVD